MRSLSGGVVRNIVEKCCLGRRRRDRPWKGIRGGGGGGEGGMVERSEKALFLGVEGTSEAVRGERMVEAAGREGINLKK